MKRSRQESSNAPVSGFLFSEGLDVSQNEHESVSDDLAGTQKSESKPKTKRTRSAKSSKSTDPTVVERDDSLLPESSVSNLEVPSDSNSLGLFPNTEAPAVSSTPIAEATAFLPEIVQVESQDSHLGDSLNLNPEISPLNSSPAISEKQDTKNIDGESDNSLCRVDTVSTTECETASSIPNTSETLVSREENTSKFQSSEPSKPSSYQVVARRYRPQLFNELIGQETVARALSNAIETNRVGHAYLFTGARGVGKTSCARIFAKALNCVHGPTTHPCLQCDSCIGVATGDDVDVIEIDGASNRGVDEIRLLRQNATIAPTRSTYKIYIIDEVHMLTREAFNALLKTLEEPPARVKFIFCTTEPNKIPITILSRCQRFDFSGINGASISDRLAQIAAQEGAEAEEGVFEVLARRANGSMRDAQSLLEQLLSFAPNFITQADVHSMLGSVDDRKIFDLLDATVKGDPARAFELLGEAASQGVDFGILIEQILGVYRDLMVVGSGCGAKELMYSPVARLQELQSIAKVFGLRRILASLQILDQTVQRMRISSQARILAELAFARLCQLDSFQTIDSLLVQLKQGIVPNLTLSPVPNALTSEVASTSQKKNDELNSDDSNSTLQRSETSPVLADAVLAGPDAYKAEQSGVTSVQIPEDSNSNVLDVSCSDSACDATPHSVPPTVSTLEDHSSEDNNLQAQILAAWLSYSENQLFDCWTRATNSSSVLREHAQMAATIRTETPNVFNVLFPANCVKQQTYCENEKANIIESLSKILGSPLELRLIIDSTLTATRLDNEIIPPVPSTSIPKQPPYPSDRETYGHQETRSEKNVPLPNSRELTTAFNQHYMIQGIKEYFNLELTEIKAPEPNKPKPKSRYFFQ